MKFGKRPLLSHKAPSRLANSVLFGGNQPGEFLIQVIDNAQQVSAVYPTLKFGNFPAQREPPVISVDSNPTADFFGGVSGFLLPNKHGIIQTRH